MKTYTAEIEVFIFQDKEDGLFYADCPSLELIDVGNTIEEAKVNFENMLSLFFDDIIERGTFHEAMAELGWKIKPRLAVPRRKPSRLFPSILERLTETRELAVM